jgi:hypothetical protein
MAPRSLFAALLACASLAVARKPTLEERGVPKDPTGIFILSNRLRFKLTWNRCLDNYIASGCQHPVQAAG